MSKPIADLILNRLLSTYKILKLGNYQNLSCKQFSKSTQSGILRARDAVCKFFLRHPQMSYIII